jgi:peptidyl-prolyl cis-trans isomerase C
MMIILSLLCLTGPSTAEDSADPDKKVAVVNGTVITEAAFNREMERVQRQYAAMGGHINDTEMPAIRKDVIENLIAGELLYQKSQEEGIKVDEAEVNAHIEGLKKRFPDETKYKNALESAHLSEASIRSDFTRAKAIGQLIDKQIYENVAVSEEETKKYYDENQKLFVHPEQVRASHILIKVDAQADDEAKAKARAQIEDIKKKLESGEDFAALAEEHSGCPSAAKGGDLGFFRRGQMVPPFEEAAFGLKPGELSDVVETRFGYHIIKVTDHKAEAPIEFEKVKDKLEQHLRQSKLQEEVARYIQDLEKDAKIERLLPETSE